MADENAKNAAVEAAKEETVDVPADKTKTVIMSLIILSVLVMLLTPAVTFLVVRTMMPTNQESAPEDSSKSNVQEISIEPFRTNIAGTQGMRYSQITVVFEVSDGNMLKYFQKKSAECPEGMLNRIRARITGIISDKTLSGLLSKDAQTSLANEIKTTLNADLFDNKKEMSGQINEVYFPSFLVQ
ncbi:MAG: hypothetical protein A2020_02945 [Lentisphaerae bacterium GWF2_45_14]|nr:MAG: hypothetical protein A2020_02945 [Lentisphaerae bacterium GWF2_45_14]